MPPSGSASVTIHPPTQQVIGVNSPSGTLPQQNYYDYCTRVIQKPWWAGRPNATAWQRVMGTALDAQLDGFEQARACRFPTIPDGGKYAIPDDALYLLAGERGLEQVPGESTVGWRARLQQAWLWWSHAGTQQGHVEEFGWYGLTNVKVVRRKEWATPPAVGSNYVQAFAQTVYYQCEVLVRYPHPWKQKTWGDGWKWGDGTSWGSSMLASDVAYFRRQIQQFKGGHDTVTYLYVSFVHGRVWGDFKWGDGGVWGGTGQTMAIVVGEQSWGPRGLL